MKKYSVAILCFVTALGIIGFQSFQASGQSMYMYPNLPAPIGSEPILITSAGQSVEGGIVNKLSQQLYLEAEYRPRALATDLYEYKTLVVVVGYSYNGLLHKNRKFSKELERIQKMMDEAAAQNIPVVIFDVDVQYRNYEETSKILELVIPHAAYFIGKKHEDPPEKLIKAIERNKVKATFVNEMEDMKTPFNSVFR